MLLSAVKKINWRYSVNVKQSVLATYIIDEGSCKYDRAVLGLKTKIKDLLYNSGSIFYNQDTFQHLVAKVASDYKKLIPHLHQVIKEECQKFINFSRRFEETDFLSHSASLNFKILKNYLDHYARVTRTLIIPLLTESIIEPKLKEIIERKGLKGESLPLLSSPLKPSASFQSELQLLKIARQIKTNRKLNKLFRGKDSNVTLLAKKMEDTLLKRQLASWLKKYSWRSYTFLIGEPYDVVSLSREIAEMVKGDPQREIRKREAHERRNARELEKLLKSLTLTREEKRVIGWARQIAYLRTFRLEEINRGTVNLYRLIRALEKQEGLPRDTLVWLTVPEIIGKTWPQQREIQRRKSGYILVMINGKISFLKKAPLVKREKGSKEIKGQIAQAGCTKGIAKIVKSKEDIRKVKKKDIIVSPNTTPEFMPALKKAAAIITDIGGLTCHAAIVSRELGIPCIVGTKIATQVLKDGDLVEVDAERGIVRRLKKKQT